MRYLAGFIALLVFTAGCCSQCGETCPLGNGKTGRAHKKVLVVTGIDHPAHNWRQTAPALADVLRRDRRLDVNVVEEPRFLDSPQLKDYDVIVLHFMDWERPDPGPKARENLRQFVNDGKGLFVVHFACGAFQDWPEFVNLAGRAWDPKLRAHDPRGPFGVTITDAEHPITRGMESFETNDELYTCLAGRRPVQMLATARSKVDGKDYPMAFVFNYGKGRVYHNALGHDVKAITNPPVAELFRRGCAWAAGLPPVPLEK
ncbi:MAG: ThuA domain-containing protein [Phycisphaerales bacterium]|nr:MAG: ThuA domain-containing protein [Phycisphaerales bacterium]